MASHFSGPDISDDAGYLQVRFRDIIPENHPARYIDKFIETIDIVEFESLYKVSLGQKGRAPFNVRLMLKVILYALYCRIYSARKIDYATKNFSDFWFFTHGNRISHDKISKFIKIHENQIHPIFLATVDVANKNELLDFKSLYEDGFKIKANAANRQCRNVEGLTKETKKLSENLSAVLTQIQNTANDEEHEAERVKLENALKKIASLKSTLTQRIEERTKTKPPSVAKEFAAKATINMIDPDAELMKQKDKSTAVSYLKETCVDSKADIVIASQVVGYDNENQIALQLVNDANNNCKAIGCKQRYETVVADSGFTVGKNCAEFENAKIALIGPTQEYEHFKREKEDSRVRFTYNELTNTMQCSQGSFLQLDRSYHSNRQDKDVWVFKNPEACAQCSRLNDCTKSKEKYRTVKTHEYIGAQQRVLDRYLSEEGKILYKKRAHSAEVYQADLKHNGKFTRFLRRTLEKVRIDSIFHDIVWNLRRIIAVKGEAIVWN